ncbi:MAG: DnaB-like helicase C-terminal domain-containing protein [Methylobacter sp.]
MPVKYEFDEDFQTKVAACVFKDVKFNKRANGLIKPDYFEKDSEAAIVSAVSRYFDKYGITPSIPVLIQLLKDDVAAKIIRRDLFDDIKDSIKDLVREDISDADFVVDQVAMFARHQAMESAALEYVELIERKEYDRAAKVIADAANVSANEGGKEYDFFGDDEIAQREQIRNDRLAGIATGKTISTGIRGLNKRLFHGGWAKGEFYILMGPPKSGKSISLAFFAKNAALTGANVLFVTLEMSKSMTAERLDSSLTGIAMSELENNIIVARDKIKDIRDKAGKLYIEEFPMKTLTPSGLSRVMQKYKSNGVAIDMLVVDYADIMAPTVRTDSPIENSRSIYADLKALGQVEDVVMLSATQTNRDGIKAMTATMDNVSEDINRVRIPDLVISINATDEERARGEARLFFAASRNQAGSFSIHVTQDLEAMCFVKSIVKIE